MPLSEAVSFHKTTRPIGTKGKDSKLLESRIRRVAKKYRRLTVRQFYYIMTSRFGYPPGRQFYKRLVYHLSKMRQNDRRLHAKIVDNTREFIPAIPVGFHKVELWVEKDAIRMLSEDLAAKYRMSIQVLRGFPSISMLRKAFLRARKRGIQRILYVGDWDASGVLIQQFAEREMAGVEFRRIAITPDQARRYSLPSIGVNNRDSRAKEYVKRYGNEAWELEALRPGTFRKILEAELRANVPTAFLRKARQQEKATRIARPITNRIVRKIEREIVRLMKKGSSEKEIRKILASRYRG